MTGRPFLLVADPTGILFRLSCPFVSQSLLLLTAILFIVKDKKDFYDIKDINGFKDLKDFKNLLITVSLNTQ
jgi:hypothetical protein